MSLSKPVCGFFKGNCLELQKFLPLTISAVFYRQKLWELIFLGLELWARGPVVGLGLLAPKISLLNFYPPHVDVGQAQCASPSLTSVDGCGFFSSIVVGLPLNLFSDISERWLFYILVVILMWL